MEHTVINWGKIALMTIGGATCLFMLVNGMSDFWSRHQMSEEVIQLMSNRYSWAPADEGGRVSKHK